MEGIGEAASSAAVWCHLCNEVTIAARTAEGDWACDTCHGSFVEQLGQDVETFLETPAPPAPPQTSSHTFSSSSSSSSAGAVPDDLHAAVIAQVLGQLPLGLGMPMGVTSAPIAIVSSDGSNRPLGFVFSHTTVLSPSAGGTASATGSSTAGPAAAAAAPLVRLLSSLAQIRQGAAGFHAGDTLSNAQFEQFLHHVLMNENSHAGAPAASEELIASLPCAEKTAEDEISGECSISQEAFEVGDLMLSLPCGHRFKKEPIVHWLRMHRTCPQCRLDIASA